MDKNFSVEDFSFTITLSSDLDRKFVFRPFTKDRLEDILDQAVEVFSAEEPIGVFLGITKEMHYDLMRPVVQRSFEENLGVVCYEQRTGKIALVAMTFDVYNESINPIFPEYNNPRIDASQELWEVAEKDESVGPKKFNDLVDLWAVSTSKEFQGLGLAKAAFEWIPRYHPILSRTKVIKISASHPKTKTIVDKLGWQTKNTLNLLEYRNKKGEATFSTIKETFEKMNFMKNYTEIYYVTLERKS